MRWILCGRNTVGSRALEFLAERGEQVLAVGSAGDDGRDGWQRSFRATAERLGLPFDQPRRINDPDLVKRLADFGARALISIQYDQILRSPLLSGIGCPCLNLHFSLLPRHRGMYPIAWAILDGDAEAGVTLHHMLEQIDAGDVIAQRRIAVESDATARELYDAVANACFELFRASYPFPDALLETRLTQDPSNAVYHKTDELDFENLCVDWARPAPVLHAWLRALIFPPFQYPETEWRGRRLRIEKLGGDLRRGANGAEPGRVVARDAAGIEVAAGGGSIHIREIAAWAEPEKTAASALSDIDVGDRLG